MFFGLGIWAYGKITLNMARWYARQGAKKTVEETVGFDAKRVAFDLRYPGFVHVYSVRWGYRTDDNSYGVELTPIGERDGVLRINKLTWINGTTFTRQDLRMEGVETPLGGLRWWWVCPDCGKRRKFLYVVRPHLQASCRVCHRLVHEITQENRRDSAYASAMEYAAVGRRFGLLAYGRANRRAEKREKDRQAWRDYKRHAADGMY